MGKTAVDGATDRSPDAIDRDLLTRWQAGDDQAGNALFERHVAALWRFFAHRVSAPEASELIQATMLACVEGRTTLAPRTSFRALLFGTARHKLLNHLRGRSRRERRHPLVSNVDLAGEDGSEPRAHATRVEDGRRLLRALRSLDLDLQIAVEMFYWEELSTQEVADVLSIPVGTVKTRLFRARRQLLEQLASQGSSEWTQETLSESLRGWAMRVRHEALRSDPAEPS